ncbi:hypothetical protein BJ944DRAFT_175008, partial [Cunninghamella echinulata]
MEMDSNIKYDGWIYSTAILNMYIYGNTYIYIKKGMTFFYVDLDKYNIIISI